jgi:AraC-like DNA-binding protein
MQVPYMDVRAEYMDTRDRRVLDLRPHGLAEIPMLGWYHYVRARPDLPVHRHAGGFEICYLERGRQIFEVDGRQYRLSGGDIFITFPDEPHSTGGYPSEPGILYWLNLRLPDSGCGLLGLQCSESDCLVECLLRLPYRHFGATQQTKAMFGELVALHDRPKTFQRTIRMRCAVIRLLFEVIDGSLGHVASATSQRMAEVIQWISAHPQADFCLQDLARRAHLSVSHFKKRFKDETGLSPWQFILHHRIEIAKEQLITSDTSVTQIAYDLGFGSSQYFATVFKRMTGLTPTACREGRFPHGPSKRRHDGQQAR